MSVTTAKAAYADCFDVLDRALTSPHGVRQSAKTRSAAKHQHTRLNYARAISRNESKEIYSKDDPNYGTSAYDTLIIRSPVFEKKDLLEEGKWWIKIEPRKVEGDVEELSGAAE